MRGAPAAAVTVLALCSAACGSGTSTALATPSHGTAPPAVGSVSSSTGSTTVSFSFGSPVPAPPTARATAPPSTSTGATVAARTAAPTPVPGPCSAGAVGITTTTDLPHYTSGQMVQVSVVLHNVSAQGCVFSAPGEFTIEADPSTGQPAVFGVHLECPPAGCAPLAPGQMSTYPIGWNQVGNQGQWANQPVPAGGYHARAAFSGYPVSTSAPFSIG